MPRCVPWDRFLDILPFISQAFETAHILVLETNRNNISRYPPSVEVVPFEGSKFTEPLLHSHFDSNDDLNQFDTLVIPVSNYSCDGFEELIAFGLSFAPGSTYLIYPNNRIEALKDRKSLVDFNSETRVSNPDLYPLAKHLARHFNCTDFIILNGKELHRLESIRREFDVTIGSDPVQINQQRLSHSIIVCEDIAAVGQSDIDSEFLKNAFETAPVALISTSIADKNQSVQDLLKIKPEFTGMLRSTSLDSAKGHSVEVISSRLAPSGKSVPNDFRVVAFMPVFNEEDIIEHSLEKLIDSGVEVYVIDNWSTDSSADIAKEFIGKGVIDVERFPQKGSRKVYPWRKILRRIEELAMSITGDWFMLHDADEIRQSPWKDVSLREAIFRVQKTGYNCVDHSLFNFHPVDDSFIPGTDFESHFRLFRQEDNPANRLQLKCWSNTGQRVNLADSGGHDVQFPGRKVFPFKFIIKHYPIRSQAHGERKILRERQTRWDESERKEGWHRHYDYISETSSFLKEKDELLKFDPETFYREMLFERLTGLTPSRRVR